MRAWALALVALAAVPAAANAAPLRIAAPAKADAACRALEATAPAGERAYYAHLAKRLQTEVVKCPVADPAAALAAGTVDMAVLDPATYPAASRAARALLTVRAEKSLNRIPVLVAVRGDDPRRTLAQLKGATAAFGGTGPAAALVPRQVLAERGAPPGFFARETVDVDGEAAIERLRARRVDAVVLHAGAWQVPCFNTRTPKNPKPCKDLRIVVKARPRAEHAIVVRRDLPNEMRYRLIGIHLPMHFESPAAFAWATSWAPGAAEFQPAEAEALTLANIL